MCNLVKLKCGKMVAEVKKSYIENIADCTKHCKNINRIILFGSALETRCTERSDIDIAVFGDKPKTAYLKSKEFREFQRKLFSFGGSFTQDYDVLYFNDKEKYRGNILSAIENGAKIYRRSDS